MNRGSFMRRGGEYFSPLCEIVEIKTEGILCESVEDEGIMDWSYDGEQVEI